MLTRLRRLTVALGLVLIAHASTHAQSAGSDWTFSRYPVLAWVPSGVEVDIKVPPIGGCGDGGFSGKIPDSRFDGAFLGGFSATNNVWRGDAGGVWAAVGGDRPQLPQLKIDVDLI